MPQTNSYKIGFSIKPKAWTLTIRSRHHLFDYLLGQSCWSSPLQVKQLHATDCISNSPDKWGSWCSNTMIWSSRPGRGQSWCRSDWPGRGRPQKSLKNVGASGRRPPATKVSLYVSLLPRCFDSCNWRYEYIPSEIQSQIEADLQS